MPSKKLRLEDFIHVGDSPTKGKILYCQVTGEYYFENTPGKVPKREDIIREGMRGLIERLAEIHQSVTFTQQGIDLGLHKKL